MTWATETLGPTLLTKDGFKPTAEVIGSKKIIALYFSAHWCPPCRGFTPVLGTFYDALNEEHPDQVEIVFVSSDSDQGSFEEYYGSMPWVSIPFDQTDRIQALGTKFGVRGIPALIVVDADGAVKDREGRSTVVGAKGNTAKALQQWA